MNKKKSVRHQGIAILKLVLLIVIVDLIIGGVVYWVYQKSQEPPKAQTTNTDTSKEFRVTLGVGKVSVKPPENLSLAFSAEPCGTIDMARLPKDATCISESNFSPLGSTDERFISALVITTERELNEVVYWLAGADPSAKGQVFTTEQGYQAVSYRHAVPDSPTQNYAVRIGQYTVIFTAKEKDFVDGTLKDYTPYLDSFKSLVQSAKAN